jgi:hypothetical protein
MLTSMPSLTTRSSLGFSAAAENFDAQSTKATTSPASKISFWRIQFSRWFVGSDKRDKLVYTLTAMNTIKYTETRAGWQRQCGWKMEDRVVVVICD